MKGQKPISATRPRRPAYKLGKEEAHGHIGDPAASDFERLGRLAAEIAYLRNATDPSVQAALKQICSDPTPITQPITRSRSKPKGREFSASTPANAVVIFYLHRMLRFLEGHNLGAKPGALGHIEYPIERACQMACLTDLSADTEKAWFGALWKMIGHDYQGLPCMPGIDLTYGLPHNLHQIVATQFHQGKVALMQDVRVMQKREPTESEEAELMKRAATKAAYTLRYNLHRAFRVVVRNWDMVPQFTNYPHVFLAFRRKAA